MDKPATVLLEHKQAVLRRYRRLGAVWGVLVGGLIGIAGASLQMTRWENPWIGCVVAPLVLALVGGCIGYFFYDLLFDSQIRGALEDIALEVNGDSSNVAKPGSGRRD